MTSYAVVAMDGETARLKMMPADTLEDAEIQKVHAIRLKLMFVTIITTQEERLAWERSLPR